MKVNQTLQTLNLQRNQIGDAGAVAIAGALKVNPSMYKLSLRLNEIRDAGAIAIAEALAVNNVLVEFYCGGNRYSQDAKQKLKDSVEGRPDREGRPVDPYAPTKGGRGPVRSCGSFLMRCVGSTARLPATRPSPQFCVRICGFPQ